MLRRAVLATLFLVLGACRQQPGPSVFLVELEARPIMQQWAEALGGRERMEKVKGWHFKAKLSHSGGATGTSETWLAPNGRSKTISDVGPEHEVYATNGKRAWIRDTNGSVRELAGLELDAAALDEVVSSIFMREPRRKGRVVKVTATRVRFELADNSTTAEVELDPKTFLPVTMTLAHPDQTWTRRYADWRSSAGIKQPFTVVTEYPDGRRIEVRLTTVETMEPPTGIFAKPESLVADVKWATPAPVEIALTPTAEGIMIAPVTIAGKLLNFVVDTGASATTVAEEQVAALGLTAINMSKPTGVEAPQPGSHIEKLTYQVGGVTLGPQLVEAWPLAMHASATRLDGALGYDFLSRFVVELDVSLKKLRLHEPRGWKPPAGAIELPITLETGLPHVVATLVLSDGRRVEGNFVVDLGCACDVKLSTGFDADHGVTASLPGARPAASAQGTTGKLATLPALELGKLKLENLALQAPAQTEGFLSRRTTAGLLGIRLLAKYVVVFDYANKRMYLVTK